MASKKNVDSIVSEAGQKTQNFFRLSLAEMISAVGTTGRLKHQSRDFSVDAASIEDEEVEMKEFRFSRWMTPGMTPDEFIAEMAKEGWKPASIWHLLFFGFKYPKKQEEYTIIALGSVWHRYVAFLSWGPFERRLGLDFFGSRWDADDRFLAGGDNSWVSEG
jgi:hypothetical protein